MNSIDIYNFKSLIPLMVIYILFSGLIAFKLNYSSVRMRVSHTWITSICLTIVYVLADQFVRSSFKLNTLGLNITVIKMIFIIWVFIWTVYFLKIIYTGTFLVKGELK